MNRFLPAAFGLIALLCPGAADSARAGDALDIPKLTWTPRSDWLNVKDAPFNAKGDGVTDDTAAIQAALTAAAAHGSMKGTVYLPPGTYLITATLGWEGSNTPWKGTGGNALIGCGRDTVIRWGGPEGGTMFAPNGGSRVRYLGLAWDGANSAAWGYDHNSHITYESRIRHQNESFRNFTAAAIHNYGGGSTGNVATAETMVWNCLFKNCATGVINGSTDFNGYQWSIVGCEFEQCGTGISAPKGKTVIFDDHFDHSAVADIATTAGLDQSIRRCTSTGSGAFFTIAGGGSASPQNVEDCRIDGWTNPKGAIQIGSRGPVLVFDCIFTHPPDKDTAPISFYNPPQCPSRLIVSNNSCPGLPENGIVSPGPASRTVTIPPGKRPMTPLTPQTTFLKTTWPADSTHILDVTQAPYNAVTDQKTDVTAAIQAAIDDARKAANGSVVYLPRGHYKISSTLQVTGSNYTIEGSGLQSTLDWAGPEDGTMMSVVSPHKIALEQFQFQAHPTVTPLRQTGDEPCDVTYSGVYDGNFGAYNCDGIGVCLLGLPKGSKVYFEHLDTPLHVTDCGEAEILANFYCGGELIIDGAKKPKTGFLGILNAQCGQFAKDPTYWDIQVHDDQNLIVGHYYQEQGYNHLLVDGGAGTTPGHVTIMGVKQQAWEPRPVIQVNNYQGRVMYGPQAFANQFPAQVTQTGTQPCDLVLLGDMWGGDAPAIATASGCNLVRVQNIEVTTGPPYQVTYPDDVLPDNGLAAVAAGLDDLRQLGEIDLLWNYGMSVRDATK